KLPTTKTADWTLSQEAHVKKLAAEFNARTPGSKALAERYRPVYATPRAVIGFRPEWKELIYPLHVERADGAYVWDVDGNRYVDVTMGFGATLFGHNPSFVRRAIEEELARGMPLGPQHPRAGRVAELIAEMTGNERAALFTTGSEAVMVAVRLARAVTGRSKIVIFTNSYHGTFDGLLAAGWADGATVATMPVAAGTPQSMVDEVIVLRYGDADALDTIRHHADRLAAVLVEPVQSRDPGTQPMEFARTLRQLTAERDIALIFDEMILGFRVHPGGAQARFGVQADIVTYGKVTGGGVPMGVVAGKARFLDAIDGGMWHYGDDSVPRSRTAFVAGTFNSHPLTVAAAEAVLEELKRQGSAPLERLNERTALLCADLDRLFEVEDVPIRMSYFGSLFRFNFKDNTEILNYHLLKNGVFVWEGRNCFLSLAHADEDVRFIIEAVKRSVAEMRAGGWLPPGPPGGGRCNLARGQREMWFLMESQPEAIHAYTEMVAVDLQGVLDAAALERALARLVARHEVLRTWDMDGETCAIAPASPVALPVVPVADDDVAVRTALVEDIGIPLDLRGGPPLRVRLLRRAAERHILSFVIHHMVADGWSLGLLLFELATLYSAERTGRPPHLPAARPFSDFVRWAAGLEVSPDAPEPAPPVTLPADEPLAPRTGRFKGGRIHRRDPLAPNAPGQPERLHARTKVFAQAEGVSPFMVMLAGYAVLLGRLSGQTRFAIGIPLAGHGLAGLPMMAGMASSVLSVPVTLNPAEPFRAVVARMREATIAAQAKPARLFAPDVDGPADAVNVMFNFDREARVGFDGLTLDWVSPPLTHVKVDLFLNVMDLNGVPLFDLDYDQGVIGEATAVRWFDSFVTLLGTAAAAPDTPLADLPLDTTAVSDTVELVDGFGGRAAVGVLAMAADGRFEDRLARRRADGSIEIVGRLVRRPHGWVDLDAEVPPAAAAHERVAPRTPEEARMAALWTEVLGADAVGVTDGFFDLGGHSLKAVVILNRVAAEFGRRLTIRQFLDAPTVAGLTALLAASGSAVEEIPHLSQASDYDPSNAQARLWMLEQLDPGLVAYNVPFHLESRDPVDAEALARALARLAERHESLRTAILERDGLPRQVVLPTVAPPLDIIDLSLSGDAEAAARHHAETLSVEPFDLAHAPLWRVSLLVLPDRAWVAVSMHHIISDGWSLGVFVRDLLGFYREETGAGPADLPSLPVQYRDYAAWANAKALADTAHLDWWRETLAAPPPVLTLPGDRPRPAVKSHAGATRRGHVPQELAARIKGLARTSGTSLYSVLMAAFKALVHRATGSTDILIGTLHAGRDHPDLADQIGFFVNALPIRDRVDPQAPFSALIAQVRTTLLDAFDRADTPFDRIVEALALPRDPSHTPLFDIVFVLEDVGEVETVAASMGITGHEIDLPATQFELAFCVTEKPDGIAIAVVHSTDVFGPARIDALIAAYLQVLEAVAADPTRPLAELPGPMEVALPRPTSQAAAVRRPSAATTVEMVAGQAAAAPDAIAVMGDGLALTYAELETRAARLARQLRHLGVGQGAPVGIGLPRSPALVVALLGVLKSGGACVPLHPDYPAERLSFMVADARCPVVLTQEGLFTGVDLSPARLITLDAEGSTGTPEADLPPPPARGALAYVIYTSGSTGTPKGVGVEHGSFADHVAEVVTQYGMAATDRVLAFASISFDVAFEQVFAPLAAGAAVVIADGERWAPQEMAAVVRRHGLTVLDLPAAYWGELVTHWKGHPADVAGLSLKVVVVGGEEMPAARVPDWFTLPIRCDRLLNAYGPTEAVITASLHHVTRADAGLPRIPIGRPLGDRRAYVVGSGLEALPIGAEGELCIGGDTLARGYLNRVDLTAERFVEDPFRPGGRLYRTGDRARFRSDGTLEFLGRLDQQIKVRGFRIEPGEIEHALRTHPGVRDAAVIAEGGTLAAYLAAGDGVERDDLRRHLAATLPEHMIPARFRRLDALPLTASGKVDRKALAGLDAADLDAGKEAAGPASDLERAIADLWREVLGIDRVGRDDNFFELGGFSLKANQVVVRLRQRLGADLTLKDFFAARSLAELAAVVESRRLPEARPEAALVTAPLPADGTYPLSSGQRGIWLIQSRDPEAFHYNMVGSFLLTGPVDATALARALEALIHRHAALRTRFVVQHGEPRQRIEAPPAGFALALEDRRDTSDADAVLAVVEDEERRHAFDLTTCPLWRARLIRLPDADGLARHALVFNLHHIIFDGWSTAVLLSELEPLYRVAWTDPAQPAAVLDAAAGLTPLAIQYPDYTLWQLARLSEPALTAARAHWLGLFEDGVPVLSLPTDRPRPAALSGRGGLVTLSFGADVSNRLRMLARAADASLFTVMAALVHTQLHLLGGDTDIVVGTPVAGRNHPDLEGQLGYFLNMLPLRAQPTGDMSFRVFLETVRSAALDAFAHQEYPFDRLLEELDPPRHPGRHPLFDVVVNHQNTDPIRLSLDGLGCETRRDASISAKYDLNFMIDDQAVLGLSLEYAGDLFAPATAERMARDFLDLVAAVVDDPSATLAELAAQVRPLPPAAVPVMAGAADDLIDDAW
ncbi:MAG TPA: amino acid adenylation domain-containing protein, partial [Azospirillaceae bacterium]|nr:amino acid adenylation domain-containing protein [Azospirillaceae bacterium]